MKVALLTTGPVTDGGWNQSAYEGLERIQKTLGAQVAKQENLKPDAFEGAFRDYARQGYNIIFAHDDEFGPAATKVALCLMSCQPEHCESCSASNGSAGSVAGR